MAAVIGLVGPVAASASVAASTSSKPLHGGRVIVAGFNNATLDPGNPAWTQGGLAFGVNLFGQLFSPVAVSAGAPTGVAPDLATNYAYSNGLRTLTITLRKNLTFQDGTPLNASAVIYNFDRALPAGATTYSQYFSTVTSISKKNNLTVVVHFNSPDANFVDALADTAAGLMSSPSALTSMGEAAFGLKPVGAGPFEVVSDQPAQELIANKFAGYWDAKHIYLASIEYLNIGTDPNVAIGDLSANTVQVYSLTTNSSPQVIQSALSLPGMRHLRGGNLMVNFLQINTHVPPFNNQQAREAIDYCTDRGAVNSNIDGGFSAPGWVFAGPDGLYYPKGGLTAAKGYLPYQYDPAKGKALVQSVGGINFTFIGGNATQTINFMTALQQMWQACGMTVKVDPVQAAQQQADYGTGAYQMVLGGSGGITNPNVSTDIGYLESTSSLGKYGFSSPTVLSLINATNYTTNPTALYNIWQRIYKTVNQLAVAIDVVTARNIFLQTNCLKGDTTLIAGVVLTNSYYTCNA